MWSDESAYASTDWDGNKGFFLPMANRPIDNRSPVGNCTLKIRVLLRELFIVQVKQEYKYAVWAHKDDRTFTLTNDALELEHRCKINYYGEEPCMTTRAAPEDDTALLCGSCGDATLRGWYSAWTTMSEAKRGPAEPLETMDDHQQCSWRRCYKGANLWDED